VLRQQAQGQRGTYDRNRDGRVDRQWDRNRNGQIDRRNDNNRRYDRNDNNRRYDRNDNNRYDRNRNGYNDRRYRDNDRGRNWNRSWRDDRRYNWRDYRQQYGNRYRLGSYYSPYRNHRYTRFSIGFSLNSLFYSQRYWINDPWQYRLPPADGGYRWVRYYDDVLLVDTYSGEVVDVIYDFFW
jgi:Ni/Co efflux regulator RcnB